MSTRLKLIGTVILLGLALLATIFSVIQTVQAIQRLEENRHLVASGDVRTIRPLDNTSLYRSRLSCAGELSRRMAASFQPTSTPSRLAAQPGESLSPSGG